MTGPGGKLDAAVPWLTGAAVLTLLVGAVWNGIAFEPFVPTPPGTSYFPRVHTLLAPGQSRRVLLGVLMACAATIAVGLPLVRRLLASDRPAVDRGLALLVAFLPGYLAVVAVNRVLTLALPNLLAAPAALAAGALLAAWGVASVRAGKLAAPAEDGAAPAAAAPRGTGWAVALGAAALVVAAFALLQVQAGGAFVLGDGAAFFLDLVREPRWWAPDARFPVVTQHYDELMFLYPAVALDPGRAGLAVVDGYWVAYAFGKAACFAALVLAAASLARSRLLGLLAALLCFFGPLWVAPARWFGIFDSSNPLWFNLHPARVFIAILPVLVLAVAARLDPARPLGAAELAALALAGLGLSAMPLHAAAVVAFAAFVAVVARQEGPAPEPARLVLLALLGAVVTYAARRHLEPAAVAVVLCLGALAPAAWRGVRALRSARGWVVAVAVTLIAVVAGALLLGNLPAGRVHARLGAPLAELVTRLPLGVPLAPGRNPFCGTYPLLHCKDLGAFAAALGLPLVVAGAAMLLQVRALRRGVAIDAAELGLARALAFMAAALLASLFVLDFLDGRLLVVPEYPAWLPVWLKSRLVEPWFYATLVLGLAAAWRGLDERGRRALATVAVVWLTLRHVLSPGFGIVAQLRANASYLASHLW